MGECYEGRRATGFLQWGGGGGGVTAVKKDL